MGYELTSTEIHNALSALPRASRQSALLNPGHFQEFIDKLLVRNAIAEQGNKKELYKNPNTILKIEDAKREILAAEAIEDHLNSQTLPDFSMLARQEYDLNKRKYSAPETIQVAHILIKTDSKQRTNPESKALATEILKKLKNGDSFEELAKEYSEDSSASNGGKLPSRNKRGDLVKPFEEAAFSLDSPGSISRLVTTKFGYHIIKLIDKQPAHTIKFENAKDKIISNLKDKQIGMIKSHYIEQFQRPHLKSVDFNKLLRELNNQRSALGIQALESQAR